MSVNSYATGVLPSDDANVTRKCLIAAGYTNPYMGVDSDGKQHCHVDDTVASATMKTAIEAAHATVVAGALTHNSVDPLIIPGDGVATSAVTITDPRGAAASGKTVKLRVPPGVYMPVSGETFVLDAAGQAVVTFGPLVGCLGDVPLEFYYANGEVDSMSFVLHFG